MLAHFYWLEEYVRMYSQERLREAEERRLIRRIQSRKVRRGNPLFARVFTWLGLRPAGLEERGQESATIPVALCTGQVACCSSLE